MEREKETEIDRGEIKLIGSGRTVREKLEKERLRERERRKGRKRQR